MLFLVESFLRAFPVSLWTLTGASIDKNALNSSSSLWDDVREDVSDGWIRLSQFYDQCHP